jgi:carboxyl-terminal processing protease
MSLRRLLLSVLVLGLVGLGAGFWMPRDDLFALRKSFQIFGALYEELVGGYVDPLNPERMMQTSIEAMLQDLDPYTTFYDEQANTEAEILNQGRYGGVGLSTALYEGRLTVVEPAEGSSAFRQGVRIGDVITAIAGQPTAKMTLREAGRLLMGEPGTAVEIMVERVGEPEPLRFLLTRREAQTRNVGFSGFVGRDTTAGIGYIRLDRFMPGSAAEVRRALQGLQQAGTLRGLILDLRDNPGGLLEDAVEILSLFVPAGTPVVTMRGRLPQSEQAFRSRQPPLAPDLPVVVVVNGVSASASEIVSGAMQDLDRGVILGTTTFGKGLVQIVRPLPYNTALKLTTARYYIPSGRSIQAIDYGIHDGSTTTIPDSLRRTFRTAHGRMVKDGRGIEPDVMLASDEKSALEEALDRRAAFFFYANHYAITHPTLEPAFAVTEAVLQDFQAWLQTQHFAYATPPEHAMETLLQQMKATGYEARRETEALQQALMRQKAADFSRHAERLKARLHTEILARYHTEQARLEAALTTDPLLVEATRLLQNPSAYQRLLRP